MRECCHTSEGRGHLSPNTHADTDVLNQVRAMEVQAVARSQKVLGLGKGVAVVDELTVAAGCGRIVFVL